MMKWIQFALIPLLVLGFPLFQMDQIIDTDWLVCEKFPASKVEYSNLNPEEGSYFNFKHLSFLPSCIGLFFQLKNPLSVLFASFWGTSPFWRPPPWSLSFG